MESFSMSDPFKRSGADLAKTLAYFLGAIGLLIALIYFAPIISHAG
jgi:hypothetical protein